MTGAPFGSVAHTTRRARRRNLAPGREEIRGGALDGERRRASTASGGAPRRRAEARLDGERRRASTAGGGAKARRGAATWVERRG
jgi:hypothetical protein